jgi:hypothetical protein
MKNEYSIEMNLNMKIKKNTNTAINNRSYNSSEQY